MPRSSWFCFLNQLLPVNSCQLQAQDCNTTVVGSEHDTVTHIEGEEEDLQDWSNNIILKTASSLLATPSTLLFACCNSEELPSVYPAIINQFGVSHHKETLYVYVQALFAKDDAVIPIHLRACYHGSYNVEWLIGEVNLCLHVTAKDTSGFSLQHVYTITQRNQYICEVACIWALEQSANPELTRTLGLDLQDNAPHHFSLALLLFVQAVKDNNPQLYLPLDMSVAHFMWYPPKASLSVKGILAGMLHLHGGLLLDCLTICSAFSACGGWGSLVNKSNLWLPLCGWTGMPCNSQLAWCQMLVALAFVRNRMHSAEYKLVAPLVPLSASKYPCSASSCCSIPCLPVGSIFSTGTSNGPPGNGSLSSGSGRRSPE
ncbi:hypothetical protein DSO57_1008085 [Entomophthora muscae]|uniref:Uncharacterized protein n=1 Tax=Entomophthora muscae TaxID=34485 RepID=A0ACC2RYB3_9FUNG|nr:hypothetical protein DSO57_1008085 [Entomophthora muscae]